MFGSGSTTHLAPAEQKPLGLSTFRLATDEQTIPLPVLYGAQRFAYKALGALFNPKHTAVMQSVSDKADDVVAGYLNYAGIAGLFCHGPVNRLSKIYFDDKVVWEVGEERALEIVSGVKRFKRDRIARFVVKNQGAGYAAPHYSNGVLTTPTTVDILIDPLLPPGPVNSGGAIGIAVVSGGRIAYVAIEQQGEGFTVPPTIRISGIGSGAIVEAVLGEQSFVDINIPSTDPQTSEGSEWRFYFGGEEQDFDINFLKLALDPEMRLPHDFSEEPTRVDHPAYVGQSYFVARKQQFGYNRDTAPNIEIVAHRFPTSPLFTPQDLDELDGEANVACVVSDMMLNKRYGRGYPQDRLEPTTFAQVAAIRDTPEYGFSPLFTEQESFDSALVRVLEYYDGFYSVLKDGRLAIYLAREIEPADTSIMLFDESCLIDVPDITPGSYEETSNFINVKWRNRDADYKPDAAPGPEAANFEITQEFKPLEVERPWITNQIFADTYARSLAFVEAIPKSTITLKVRKSKMTRPIVYVPVTIDASLDKVTETGHLRRNGDPVVFAGTMLPGGVSAKTIYYVRNRTANTYQVSALFDGALINFSTAGTSVTIYKWTGSHNFQSLSVGDGIRFSWTQIRLCNFFGRVTEIEIPDPYKPEATITFEVDRAFSLDSGWLRKTVPATPKPVAPAPQQSIHFRIEEIPFNVPVREPYPYVSALVAKGNSHVTGFQLRYNDGGGYRGDQFCYTFARHGTLSAALDLNALSASVLLDQNLGDDSLIPTIPLSQQTAWLLFIGNEIFNIHTPSMIDPNLNEWTFTIRREALDSKRETHAIGDEFFLISAQAWFTQASFTNYQTLIGNTNQFKILPFTPKSALDISIPDPITYTYTDRAKRPWKPRNLSVASASYPTFNTWHSGTAAHRLSGEDLTVGWIPINRATGGGTDEFTNRFSFNIWYAEVRLASASSPTYPGFGTGTFLQLTASPNSTQVTFTGFDLDRVFGTTAVTSDIVIRLFTYENGQFSRYYDEMTVLFGP